MSAPKIFAFRLALSLGCTVDELSERMSSDEFDEWIDYYNIEPWGSTIDGMRHATTAAVTANAGLMVADPARLRSKPFSVKDFNVGIQFEEKTKSKPEDNWKDIKAKFAHYSVDTEGKKITATGDTA